MLTKLLEVKLSDSEVAMKASLLAKALDARDDIEAQKVSWIAAYKSRVETAEEEVSQPRSVLRTRSEQRPINCREEKNYTKGIIEFVREDTGEVVDHRAMTTSEKQVTIPGVDGAPARTATWDPDTAQWSEDPVRAACPGCGVVAGGANTHRADCEVAHPVVDSEFVDPVVDAEIIAEGRMLGDGSARAETEPAPPSTPPGAPLQADDFDDDDFPDIGEATLGKLGDVFDLDASGGAKPKGKKGKA